MLDGEKKLLSKIYYPKSKIMAFKKVSPKEDYSGEPREAVEGSWQCADCGVEINQLPFRPLPDKPVYCKDCWSKRRSQAPRGGDYPRQTVEGSWQCADCGVEINQLPFRPLPDKPVYCKDCWSKRRR